MSRRLGGGEVSWIELTTAGTRGLACCHNQISIVRRFGLLSTGTLNYSPTKYNNRKPIQEVI